MFILRLRFRHHNFLNIRVCCVIPKLTHSYPLSCSQKLFQITPHKKTRKEFQMYRKKGRKVSDRPQIRQYRFWEVHSVVRMVLLGCSEFLEDVEIEAILHSERTSRQMCNFLLKYCF